jgi:hypothetical protein
MINVWCILFQFRRDNGVPNGKREDMEAMLFFPLLPRRIDRTASFVYHLGPPAVISKHLRKHIQTLQS